jgi:hypothetical protein
MAIRSAGRGASIIHFALNLEVKRLAILGWENGYPRLLEVLQVLAAVEYGLLFACILAERRIQNESERLKFV